MKYKFNDGLETLVLHSSSFISYRRDREEGLNRKAILPLQFAQLISIDLHQLSKADTKDTKLDLLKSQ